jgi:hypothetical protein
MGLPPKADTHGAEDVTNLGPVNGLPGMPTKEEAGSTTVGVTFVSKSMKSWTTDAQAGTQASSGSAEPTSPGQFSVLSANDAEDAAKALLYGDNLAARLATHRYFENLTLAVISFNALWIGVDMELNSAPMWLEAHPVFKIADNFFCTYFSFEVIVRFLAFKSKLFFWKDRSFLFDGFLVALMVLETWVFVIIAVVGGGGGGGGMRQLSILRLLRLLRLTRMARLMRSFPELLTLIHGLVAALRSVATTFLFQVGIMWVFGIIFTQTYRDGDGEINQYFRRLGITMVTLFVQGTLLDELTGLAMLLKDDSTIMMVVFFAFVLISSMTLLNMLIGVVTAVVSETADAESGEMAVQDAATTLQAVFCAVDSDGSDSISHEEFCKMLEDQPNGKPSKLVEALFSLGIEQDRLQELGRQLFEVEETPAEKERAVAKDGGGMEDKDREKPKESFRCKELSFKEFMDELLLLRPGDAVSVRDITTLRRAAAAMTQNVQKCVEKMDEEIEKILASKPDAEPEESRALPAVSKLRGIPTKVLMDEVQLRASGRAVAGGGAPMVAVPSA